MVSAGGAPPYVGGERPPGRLPGRAQVRGGETMRPGTSGAGVQKERMLWHKVFEKDGAAWVRPGTR